MTAFKTLFLASFAALVAAQQQCGKGEWVDGCCVCYAGWKVGASEQCDECSEGYLLEEDSQVCSNGRAGAACTDGLEYPYWGCSKGGVAIGQCSAGGVFPCICEGGNCEQTVAERSSSCYPVGTRMYTSFPNQPIVDKPYSLTFVGCQLTEADRYAVIPAYTGDLSAERPCATLGANMTGGISTACTFTKDQAADLSANENKTCSGKNGFIITGLKEQEGKTIQGMTEFTFQPITMDETVFGGSLQERAAAYNVDKVIEKETYFRVCKLTTMTARDGSSEYAWAEVATHDTGVSKRDFVYKISKEAIYDPMMAAAAGEEEDDCCDGLKLGSLCLPLWVLLLLWLLMACCLGLMGYTLHKNKNEIEAQKNNEKYEKFNVDAEMSAMAAKQAEDDDDI